MAAADWRPGAAEGADAGGMTSVVPGAKEGMMEATAGALVGALAGALAGGEDEFVDRETSTVIFMPARQWPNTSQMKAVVPDVVKVTVVAVVYLLIGLVPSHALASAALTWYTLCPRPNMKSAPLTLTMR